MKMRGEGGGGGGGGGGPLEAKELLDAKFRYDCEIFACTNFHLQNNNKI